MPVAFKKYLESTGTEAIDLYCVHLQLFFFYPIVK